jgi:Domain of unknown function (DUF5664)
METPTVTTYRCMTHMHDGTYPCVKCAGDAVARHERSWEKVLSPVRPEPVVAPVKAVILPQDATLRKGTPVITGVLDYFPLAIAEVARLSKAGNDQHNPGKLLHWDRTKSLDHADCIGRHLIDRGALDDDGQRHSAKLAWRALALLQTELELEAAANQRK